MKIIIVGGNFNEEQGKKSGLVNKIANYLHNHEKIEEVSLFNGGNIDKIKEIYEGDIIDNYDVILWFPNIPNEFEKYRDIKKKYPKKMLVTSKRNNNEYQFNYLVNHALSLKSNLVLEFSKNDDVFYGRLFDPLANVWHDYDSDFKNIVNTMVERLLFLKSMTRTGTIMKQIEKPTPQQEDKFIEVIQKLSDTFHDLIYPAEGVTRFLGNASFRCAHGFPTFKEDGKVFVTRRNIDKRELNIDGFIPIERGEDGKIYFYGEHKPSVDSPIQLALYEYYKDVKYMVHSHVYIQGAPFTKNSVPCGALEEIEEIKALFSDRETNNVAINLIGHGSLIMADSISQIEDIMKNYIARPMPEIMQREVTSK